jgi:hypothetical protein
MEPDAPLEEHIDDQSVLSYLVENVRGLKAVSTGAELAYDEDTSIV